MAQDELYNLEPKPPGITEEDVLRMINGALTSFQLPSKMSGSFFQSANFIEGVQGWRLRPDGADILGSFSVTELNIPNETTANSFHVNSIGHAWWGANVADFNSDPNNAAARIMNDGSAFFSNVTITGGSIPAGIITGLPPATVDISAQDWTYSGTFSTSAADVVAWSAGTLRFSDGTAYTIGAGNTGAMSAKTYIYVDNAVSTVALQVTTNPATAVGNGKVLLAVAENDSTSATFTVMNDKSRSINASELVAGSILGNKIAAGTITAGLLSVATLSAISANLGTVTAGSLTGATIRTAASGARVEMDTTSLRGLNASGATIFEVILSGANAGDVIIGDDATGSYAKYDSSAQTFEVFADNVLTLSSDGFIPAQHNFVKENVSTLSAFDGTPRAVAIDIIGNYNIASDTNVQSRKFIGFTFDTNAVETRPTISNFQQDGSGTPFTISYTTGSGDNVCIVALGETTGSTNNSGISTITWDGTPMINAIQSGDFNQIYDSVWYLPIGNLSGPITRNLAVTQSHPTSNGCTVCVMTMVNVNQTQPVLGSLGTSGTSGSTVGPVQGWEATVVGAVQNCSFGISVNGDPRFRAAEMDAPSFSFGRPNGSSAWAAATAFQAAVGGATIDVVPRGQLIGGFTGLTPGNDYYLSTSTAGGITTTVGNVKVGIAVSATELLTTSYS